MRRPGTLPVFVQVAALAATAVALSHAVAFAVVLLSPDPPPAGFSLEAAATALEGRPARTSDGKRLQRRVDARPVTAGDDRPADPLEAGLAAALANRLDAAPSEVRVRIDGERHAFNRRMPGPAPVRARVEESTVYVMTPGASVAPPAPPPEPPPPPLPTGVDLRLRTPDAPPAPAPGRVVVNESGVRQFTVTTDRLTFAPFSASLRLEDGRWATVEPPRGLLSPWQSRLLLALAISLLLLAPLVWWMARRLTRPIRVFAAAAERLGADPDAEPLTPSGPSEVRTAIHAFNDMQASLRDHMRRRTQTVAAIAHDLRTPLTRLRFRAEQAPDALRDRMAADVEEMDALIAQAMAYVRGEAPPERVETFDLTALAGDCARGFSETGEGVTFTAGPELRVRADPTAVRRAVANLVANALKYAGSARVSTAAVDGRAAVRVEDDGPGLPDDQLQAVFEPFHRAEPSRNRQTGGAGLGLTVARQAARAHGGEVVLITRPEGGLTAELTLPLSEEMS
ncbi:MAG TPA: ATP-binding protein [Brevundimonas sp.]|jgi:signal transduction histidine kinase|uniref:ATP-binding protein n=1 Tax=Brevundimonas sp. TaxID=1871086 RepID=UPI002DF48FFA|nr:ATP-binding protein [Brevundimonas sp.]